MKLLPLVPVLIIVICIALIFIFIFIVAELLCLEATNKIGKPLDKILDDPNTTYPINFSATLDGWVINFLCKLDTLSPRFNELLEECLTLEDNLIGTTRFDVLESTVNVEITITGRTNTVERINNKEK